MRCLSNARGQSLIEYVILVALVGVASISMVRMVQKQVKVNLANVVHGLQSHSRREASERITEEDVRKSDFSDFTNGVEDKSRR